MTRGSPHAPPEPLIGGESARLVLDTLRTFPLSRTPTGQVSVHNTAVGETAEAFARAYEQVELQLITEAAHCSHPGEHGSLHPDDYRFLVLSVMAADAKEALGELDRVEAIWTIVDRAQDGEIEGADD